MSDEAQKPGEAEILPPSKPKNPNLRGGWKPGQSGNPAGRKAGSQNRATIIARQMLDGDTEAIVQKCIALAKEGDPVALKLCIERILPVAKDRPVQFRLPANLADADLGSVSAALLKAVANGVLSPSEATAISSLVSSHRLNIESEKLKGRLSRLEQFLQLEVTETDVEEGE